MDMSTIVDNRVHILTQAPGFVLTRAFASNTETSRPHPQTGLSEPLFCPEKGSRVLTEKLSFGDFLRRVIAVPSM